MSENEKDEVRLDEVTRDLSFSHGYDVANSGITILPQRYGHDGKLVVRADSTSFVKWLRVNAPDVSVKKPRDLPSISLHSNEIWMPIVFLASDIALPIYLNLVSSYLYDLSRGNLKTDVTRVQISAEYEDMKNGVRKRFTFSGGIESLEKAIKKVDVNAIFRE
jgi:hypothetical protein